MPLSRVYIVDPEIPSTSIDIGPQLHPHMWCDQITPPIWVVDSPSSHEILDIKFPLEESILEFMVFIDNLNDYVHPQESILPSLELMRVGMMGLVLRQGAFVGASNRPPCLDPFFLCIYFIELATELFSTPPIKHSHFILPSCLDGSH
jgi:hypothetical protein